MNVEEIKLMVEAFNALGDNASQAFVWWLGAKLLTQLLNNSAWVVSVFIILKVTHKLLYPLSTMFQIHKMYGYSGEVRNSERNTILSRIRQDIASNGRASH